MNLTQFVETPDASFDQAGELAPGDELLTVQDAARFLKVSVSWVYDHVRPEAKERLPVAKLGKYLRFDRRDLQAYIDAKRAESRHRPRRR
jgi:excisionase family DNA binding protein